MEDMVMNVGADDGGCFPRDNDKVGCLIPVLFPKVCMDLEED